MSKNGSAEVTLQALRKLRGLSQKALASETGVQPTQIAETETGVRTLSTSIAKRSADALRVDWFDLFIGHNIAVIKNRVEADEGPLRAAKLAKELFRLLEEGGLNRPQRKSARSALEELVELVEGYAEQRESERITNVASNRLLEGRMDV